MKKYKWKLNKSVEIEAIKFTNENKDQVYNWAKSIQANVWHDWDENKQPILKIPTFEGTEVICSFDDYLIKVQHPTSWQRLYSCNALIFEKMYEETEIIN